METTWQLIVIVALIILTSTFILYTGNTIYCLLSLICLILALSWFLIYAGLELIGFMLTTIYLGAILIFFVFVIMLIDLRFEDLQELYLEARTYEPQGFTIIYPVIIFSSLGLLDIMVERILYDEFANLELLVNLTSEKGLTEPAINYINEYFASYSSGPTAIGFYLFSLYGASVGILTLLILFSLYISLYTVKRANIEVSRDIQVTIRENGRKKFL